MNPLKKVSSNFPTTTVRVITTGTVTSLHLLLKSYLELTHTITGLTQLPVLSTSTVDPKIKLDNPLLIIVNGFYPFQQPTPRLFPVLTSKPVRTRQTLHIFCRSTITDHPSDHALWSVSNPRQPRPLSLNTHRTSSNPTHPFPSVRPMTRPIYETSR